MEGLHFIMLLSMGAAPELKLFSNKVTRICIYMGISLLHVPFYFHVYTLYGHMLITLDLHVLPTGKTWWLNTWIQKGLMSRKEEKS